MQNIAYGVTPIGNLLSMSVLGRPGVGASQLILDVHLMMQPQTPSSQGQRPPRIVLMTGQVRIVGDAVLAQLQPEPLDLRSVPTHAVQHSAKVRTLLSPAQVRAADESRDEQGSLRLIIELAVQLSGHDGLVLCRVTDTLEVNASDWARVLREMEFEDRATFEVPIEAGRVGPPFDKAADHMREALNQLQQHHWEDALRWCREVLDELAQRQSVPTPPWTDWGTNYTNWGVPERVVAMQTAVRHLTHAGAHVKIGNAEEPVVRMAVAMTGAILRYYASR